MVHFKVAVCSYLTSDLIERIDELCSFPSGIERERIISGLQWIGVFSDKIAPVKGNLLDTLCVNLEKLMSFQPGERDLVMLQHKFVVEWQDGKTVSPDDDQLCRHVLIIR